MVINEIVILSQEHLEEVIKDMSEENKTHFRLIYEEIING